MVMRKDHLMVRRTWLAWMSALLVGLFALCSTATASPGFPGATVSVARGDNSSLVAGVATGGAAEVAHNTSVAASWSSPAWGSNQVRAAGDYGTSLDFGWGAPSCSTFDGQGANGAIGYISHDPSKDLSGGDIARLHACGKLTALVFETTTTRSTAGYGAGVDDARFSQQRLRDLGAPSYVVVYAATDQDTSGGSVNDYYRGFASVLGYDHSGIYAGIGPVRDVVCNWHTVKYGWQTIAWSYGQLANCGSGPGVVALYQRAVGNAVDWNTELVPFWGQWPANVGPVVPPDPRHFRLYATSNKNLRGLHGGPFWTRHGYRDERLEIQRYIGARKHPVKYHNLIVALKQECWDLAGRIVTLHNQGRLPYSKNNAGFRQWHLRECANGTGISA